ncbi:hypothetical protein COCSUDRAFT_33690 [Coccomyxa subellipsoidea C-169]|uniref:Uncharacterized protein n=1 Tax=Coccomyxa subellipsoidea (strain C-169) TaxID=574566 RepID=I0YSY9_COCSC|nr:hypothetical protein COCSUDRAFT_33690 [Coccomyxa subellipsoidea C-169]EIE21508.1 hypothetical protein COCSUDRAFT_33690 [Coccomyxa subellipsoidea C-169]|eukprot:XP_005646052.1 hypothetical protein COCSUDRAFT_33690 [Coccomyxa subellipsoidea C-169]
MADFCTVTNMPNRCSRMALKFPTKPRNLRRPEESKLCTLFNSVSQQDCLSGDQTMEGVWHSFP